jgi:hypothetical protein
MTNEPKKKIPRSLIKAGRTGKPVAVTFERMNVDERSRWRALGGVCRGPGSTPGTIRICPRDPVTGECKGTGCYEIPDPNFETPAALTKPKPRSSGQGRK